MGSCTVASGEGWGKGKNDYGETRRPRETRGFGMGRPLYAWFRGAGKYDDYL